MKTYKYVGTTVTGATLDTDKGVLEVMLFPGRSLELPEDHPWLMRMVRRGFLQLQENARAASARKNGNSQATQAQPAQAQAAQPAPETAKEGA